VQLLSRIILCAIFCSPVFAQRVSQGIINGWDSKKFRAAVRRDKDVTRRLEEKNTYLHLAAEKNRDTHLGVLLATTPLSGLVNAKNIHGLTAIEVAIINKHFAAFFVLLPLCDPNSRTPNKYRWTLTHLAARSNEPAMIKALHKAGADINAPDGTKAKWTPLDVAEHEQNYEAAEALRALGGHGSR
jgi:ankyrin repeat protein